MRRRGLLLWGVDAAGISLLLPKTPLPQTGRPGRSLQTLIDDWENRIPGLLQKCQVPGASMAVVTGGKLRWRRGFGVQDVRSARPVDHQTIFEAASMSKPVFAYVVMNLAEKGVIQLDKPLTRYTPERLLAGDPRLDQITARHVLSHSTGLPNWRSSQEPLRIQFTPGEKYSYSGEGYHYLQSVVTRLTGRENPSVCHGGYEGDLTVCATDIDAYLSANLLTPFRMHSSSYVPNPRFQGRMAQGHSESGAMRAAGSR